MSATINDSAITPSVVEVSFAWTPSTTFTYTSPGGLAFSAPQATVGTVHTFVATTRIDNVGNDISGPLSLVQYRWDFGDGVIAYGNAATHTYLFANLQAVTKLRVTDSKGRRWYSRAQMYIADQARAASLPLLLNRTGPAPPPSTAALPLLLNHT